LGIFKREPERSSRPSASGPRARAPRNATRVAPGVSIDSFGIVYAEPAAYNAPRPLTAAAAQVKLDDKSEAEYYLKIIYK
jgi:hypothetical protein